MNFNHIESQKISTGAAQTGQTYILFFKCTINLDKEIIQ